MRPFPLAELSQHDSTLEDELDLIYNRNSSGQITCAMRMCQPDIAKDKMRHAAVHTFPAPIMCTGAGSEDTRTEREKMMAGDLYYSCAPKGADLEQDRAKCRIQVAVRSPFADA